MRQESKEEKLSGPEVDELLGRLEELEETLRAIRSGEVDALVVSSPAGERVFTLQGAEHPYRVLVESMNEGAATLTPEGMLLYANLRFSQMIATPLEKLIGSSLYNLVQQPDQCHLMDLIKKAENSPQKVECQLQMEGGIGISSAARWFVDGFARRSKIRVDLEVPSEPGRMHQEIELALFRILQESLTNVHRHSGSPTAVVRFLLENGTVTLEVKTKVVP
ncbi:MAG: hypothetical protein NVS1B11_21540 [Terriglobales bacterium]